MPLNTNTTPFRTIIGAIFATSNGVTHRPSLPHYALAAATTLAVSAHAETPPAPTENLPWQTLATTTLDLEHQLRFNLTRPTSLADVESHILATDQALVAAALDASPEQNTPLQQARATLDDALTRTADTLATAKRNATTALAESLAASLELDAPLTLDPWARPGQDTAYQPRHLSPITTSAAIDCAEIPLGNLPSLIPPKFRLAEALGLGRNRIDCTPRFIDPTLARLPSSGKWNIELRARLDCELIATFVPDNGGDNGGEATPTPVETFRLRITSQSFTHAGANLTEAAYEKPKFYRIDTSNPHHIIADKRRHNPWVTETLASAAADRGWRLTPVKSTKPNTVTWVDTALENHLATLQAQVAATVRDTPAVREHLDALAQATNHYLSLAKPPTPTRFARATTTLANLVEAGQLATPHLEHTTHAAHITLRSTHRHALVAALPPPQQPQAAALAHHLDRLDQWTLTLR